MIMYMRQLCVCQQFNQNFLKSTPATLKRTPGPLAAFLRLFPLLIGLHRRRYLPELTASNFNLRAFGERVARNMPIQGTAADLIKKAMLHVDSRLRREGLEARLVLQVNDELIVECPEGEAEQVQRLLAEEMEHVAELAVPLTAEAHAGKSWAEAKG